jgi:tetratricopeptide (TPR) repeat protein
MSPSDEIFQQAMNQGHSAAWDQLWDQAADSYRQALAEDPDNPRALTSMALALYQMQDYEQSLNYYIKAARVSPDDPMPAEKVALLFERLGRLDRAQGAALQAAEIYLKNRDVNKAIENWIRVTRLNPTNLQAHSRLALVYEKLNQKEKAVTEYLVVASLFQHANDVEKAVRAVNHALQLMPGSMEAQQALTLLRDFKPLPLPARPRGGTAPLRLAQVRQLEAPRRDPAGESGLDPIAFTRQKALTVLANLLFEGVDDPHEDSAARRGLQAMLRGAVNLATRQVDRTRILLHLSQVVDLQTNGRNSQAAAELERAIDAGLDHAAAYFDLGLLYAQEEKIEPALKMLKSAAPHLDFALGAYLLSAQLYQRLGQTKDAALAYLEALRAADAQVVPADQADDLRQLYEPLIEALRHQTDLQAMEQLCSNISGLLTRPDWRENLGRARAQLPVQEHGGPPLPLAEMLTQARSGQVVELISSVYSLARAGYLRSAMEEAFYALQFAPTYLPLHSHMGELLLRQGRTVEATAKFLMVAQAYAARGEINRAVEIYRRILELAPMDLNARGRLIALLVSNGKPEEALPEYMELAEVYYSLADLEMARKTYTEALRLAQQPNVERTWRVQILHRMADIDLQSLDWRQALRIFEQIRTLQPSDEKARSNLIELNLRLGQETLALTELDGYLSYLTNAGQRQQAVHFLEVLAHEQANRPLIRRRLAEAYLQVGRLQDAVAELDAAGEAFLQAGDKANAQRMIEAILTLKPHNAAQYELALRKLKG